MSKPKDAMPCKPPSSSTFSFKAPLSFPSTSSPLKQRRVSLALPSSPRLVPAWNFRDDTGLDSHIAETAGLMPERKGKMRKIANDDGELDEFELAVMPAEKKQRKKWTTEETQMLVDGCNTWGVGNWKAILKDPSLKFDNRSPVDLKDRFRTYFPDAYKQHYPNAKTHLSSKVRSTLPDGTSIFEKTRSKKRRPFTEEEDRALKAGYEKHGTVWAKILKDPIFQEQNRRSTDLRDRFRNAFPDLYQAAGYKPRNAPKRKSDTVPRPPVRAATDDQLQTISTGAGPIRRRRAQTTQGYRGGTKSVPESTTCSEDEESSGGEDDSEKPKGSPSEIKTVTPQLEEMSVSDSFAEVDMDTMDPLSEPLSISDFAPSSSHSLSELTDSSHTWSSGLDAHPWSGSPTSSHLSSDYFLTNSPFDRHGDGVGMIGKSAWGTQDWFSPNPRLDPSAGSSSSSSYVGGLSPAPSSPFSFSNLNHTYGVLDRYDLFPASLPHDFASEAGVGDSHSTFSDPEMFPSTSFRGFTHHSNYAGDLIFGARTHQPQPPAYGSGFGFGSPALGLSGIQQSAGIHPMQLHTSALPGIDEIELTSITLNDQVDTSHSSMEGTIDLDMSKGSESPLVVPRIDQFSLSAQSLEDIVDLSHELHSTPPATPVTSSRPLRTPSNAHHMAALHGRSISVPPSEHRSGLPRPAHAHPKSRTPSVHTRHIAFMPSIHQPIPVDMSFQSLVSPPLMFESDDALRSSSDLVDLPFLDLHYYTSNSSALDLSAIDIPTMHSHMDNSRQGQALDLAQASSSLKSFTIPLPPPGQPQSFTAAASRLHSFHQRGQSAISPQDLLLRKGDNKRKRASWDGGVC